MVNGDDVVDLPGCRACRDEVLVLAQIVGGLLEDKKGYNNKGLKKSDAIVALLGGAELTGCDLEPPLIWDMMCKYQNLRDSQVAIPGRMNSSNS